MCGNIYFDIFWWALLIYATNIGLMSAVHFVNDSRAAKTFKDFFIYTSPTALFNLKKFKQQKKNK